MNAHIPTSPSRNPGWGGKAGASFFFGIFLLLGGAFTSFVGKSVWQVAETYRWLRTDCDILASSVRVPPNPSDSGKPYEYLVEYRYTSGGEQLSGTRWSTKGAAFERYDEAQRLVDRYRVGARAECWVNPANFHDALLERQSPLIAFAVLFPLIFVAIGAGGIWAVWRKWPQTLRSEGQPILERAAEKRNGAGYLRFFFLLFFIAGAAVLWTMTVRPLLQIVAARFWAPTPCRIVSSRVAANNDSDGSFYRVDLLFAYTFAGVPRQSSRYDFSTVSSIGYATKAAIVEKYPVGIQATCYVNPRAPAEAVLRREPFKALWFGAIGLVFLGVGAVGVLHARRLTPS